MTRIALCLDDLGLHGGVQAAALMLAERGRLGAVSCMVGAPGWAEVRGALAVFAPEQVDVGLHLDLTEAPLRPALRHALTDLIVRAFARRLPAAGLRDEIEAQLDAFEDARGAPPAHVDGHQHVHQLPQVREALLAALQRRYGAGARPWLRSTRHASGLRLPPGQPRGARFKPWLLEQLGSRGLARLARAGRYGQNARLLGVYDFQADAATYAAWLDCWLGAAREGDLLMCHAALADMPGDAIAPARRVEAQLLGGEGFDALLARHGIVLAPISRILAAAPAVA